MKIVSIVALFLGIAGYGLCAEESSRQFMFTGQNFEEFNLIAHKMKSETKCEEVTKYKKKKVWVPGKEECKTIPGKKVCAVIFGVKICGKEPAQTVCETVPGHHEYQKVPYVVSVCNPFETIARTFEAFVSYNFQETNLRPNVKITSTLNEKGKVTTTILDESKKPLVLVAKGDREVSKDGKTTYVFQTINIQTLNQNKLLNPVKEKPESLQFAENGIHFMTNRIFMPKKTAIKLMVKNTKNEKVLVDQIIDRKLYHLERLDDKTRVIFNLKKLGLELRNREYQVRVVVMVDVDGTILNENLPALKARKTKKMVYQF